jgi:tRNA A-37 threonylcarbamoyl transferase component Bud32
MPDHFNLQAQYTRALERPSENRPINRLIQYIPYSNVRQWTRQVAQNLIIGMCSGVLMIFILSHNKMMEYALFDFFRWILIPVKALLVARPGAETVWLVNFLSGISSWIDWLLIPLIAFGAYKCIESPLYLIFENDHLLLLGRSSQDGKYASLMGEIIEIDGVIFNIIKSIPLAAIEAISVERSQGKKSILDYVVKISYENKSFGIRWGDIVKAEGREAFAENLESFFSEDFDMKALEPLKQLPDRQSYTELWLREFSGAPKRDSMTPLPDGSVLQDGKYKIVKKLGTGGQASVYLAIDAALGEDNRLVVVKEFVLPVYPDLRVRMKAAERFQAEAAMLGNFKHPQIAKFIDLMIEDHRAYLVLEHVEGTTLKEKVSAEGPLAEVKVVDIARQLVDILSYLHGQNPPIVHRDLAPDNIILGPEGKIKLIDFSVAQEDTSGVTGVVVGKPNYISPEQFRGKPSTQSDIYSFGATLYFLLVGKDPPPITVLHPKLENESLTEKIDAFVAHCTELETGKRFARSADMAEWLDTLYARIHAISDRSEKLLSDKHEDVV